ncbi:MAG: hypothetical protein LQ343_002624 [Gyalolechia ehrenbergii]|nr:MAG: hypothetical protein LQ343_002624 [Gyalolechia ehrenbergii]
MESSRTSSKAFKDLMIETITSNTIEISSRGSSPRLTFLMSRLLTHLHDFARETRLNTEEWMAGIEFLTEVGKMCSDSRQEFILLSDILGLSLLVDSIAHPRPPPATEGSVLGPFHTHDHPPLTPGDALSHDSDGTPCLVLCSIHEPDGKPISDVIIDIWETDSTGHYDVQYDNARTDGRGVMRSDNEGQFWFKGIVPVSYPILNDGPVGKLLGMLGRHPWRPAHMHFWMRKEGWDGLVTALYICSDPYITSDAVFGVKSSLCVSPAPASPSVAQEYSVQEGTPVIQYHFVLVREEEARTLKVQKNREAMERLGTGKWRLDGEEGLPVMDVD